MGTWEVTSKSTKLLLEAFLVSMPPVAINDDRGMFLTFMAIDSDNSMSLLAYHFDKVPDKGSNIDLSQATNSARHHFGLTNLDMKVSIKAVDSEFLYLTIGTTYLAAWRYAQKNASLTKHINPFTMITVDKKLNINTNGEYLGMIDERHLVCR